MHLCGDLIISGRELAELENVAEVETIEGSLLVHDNPGLLELPEFPALTNIGGSISISGNAELVAVRGFPALSTLGGEIYVTENPELREFTLGEGVSSVDSLFFAVDPQLTKLDGVSALVRVENDFRFIDNAGATEVTFPALAEVGGDLFITNNLSLRRAEFPALFSVGARWTIADNASLETLSGFSMLERLAAATIARNDALTEIALTTAFAAQSIEISENAKLGRIVGAPGVRLRDWANLRVRENPELIEFAGFDAVETLGELLVTENDVLRDITGLRGLMRVGAAMTIVDNAGFEGSSEWFPALAAAEDVWIFGNPSLLPTIVDALLARVEVDGVPRVGDNKGEDTMLDPCPWAEDGRCDAEWGQYGPGTGLCAADLADCGGA
ncbi:hypothetical protein [Nannocystis sp. SCPEA4]|uniref:hypothetical protein n=1 Tax=Nannocystis sp. SCPEA4 TaxID=2996787 RepID=UPI00227059C2|nr:hypothetical protein [Nannocystis sp. SCPEA4]MCY1055489.1 hypothetical protein [Nannocystis sp. SCPEA4]